MQPLTIDFIISLDGFGSAEGWPGWWGLESPEYLRDRKSACRERV